MPHRISQVPAGGGARLDTVDAIATEKVASRDTDGTYELFEIDAGEGSGVPPHRHPWPEAYYLLEGELTVLVGRRTIVLTPGDSLTVPPDAVHTFTVSSPTVRFLAFSLTDGTGRLFRDLDRTVPSDRPIEEIAPLLMEVATRNGVRFVQPAPAPVSPGG
jgi:quercetin dioxygenase-like cupin family protein